jgi:predicted HicB family RNase H-like nuclease
MKKRGRKATVNRKTTNVMIRFKDDPWLLRELVQVAHEEKISLNTLVLNCIKLTLRDTLDDPPEKNYVSN